MTRISGLFTLTAVIVLSALLVRMEPAPEIESPGQEQAIRIPEDERKVAEAAIEQFILHGRPLVKTASYIWPYYAGSPILVSRETWSETAASFPQGQEEAFRAYADRNRQTGYWDRPPNLTVPCEFAPPVVSSLSGYWNQLMQVHPGASGVLTLSRPGFSADGRSAWIPIHINTGPGTAARLTWWTRLKRVGSSWSLVEARTLTDYDRYFAQLPKNIPPKGGHLAKLVPEYARERALYR